MKRIIVNVRQCSSEITQSEKKELVERLESYLNTKDLIIFYGSLENKIYTVDIPDTFGKW